MIPSRSESPWAFAIGAIFIAFVVYIAGKGKDTLAKYIGFFIYTPPKSTAYSP